MSYATEDDAIEYYAGDTEEFLKLEVIRNAAARLVQRYAAAPDPVPEDYPQLARYGELLVGAYLWENPGTYSGLSLAGVGSLSYAPLSGVIKIVNDVMDSYATAAMPQTTTVRSQFYDPLLDGSA